MKKGSCSDSRLITSNRKQRLQVTSSDFYEGTHAHMNFCYFPHGLFSKMHNKPVKKNYFKKISKRQMHPMREHQNECGSPKPVFT